MSPRVAGIDPGTVSFDVCGLDGGELHFEETFVSSEVGADPKPFVEAIVQHGPLDLVLGPAGYGLPLVPASRIGPAEVSLMLLLRKEEPGARGGIAGMRRIIQALVEAGLPVIFGPGVIHLPTVPAHRKWNRIDMGTADKVGSVALCIDDQVRRLRVPYHEASFIMLELGGAFSAAVAVDQGQVTDGIGGTSGPIGAQSCGALDGELAYLLGPSLSRATLFAGGALNPRGDRDLASAAALAALRRDSSLRDGWEAIEESATKAVLALTATLPSPREVLVAGRLAQAPGLLDALARRLRQIAPVRPVAGLGSRAKAAAQGAALLADGLAGGAHAPLVECMRLREARGSALDYLRVPGSGRIQLA